MGILITIITQMNTHMEDMNGLFKWSKNKP